MRLPIVSGPLRGEWWLPAARGKVMRVLGGTYEPEQTALFVRWVGEGQTVLDVGAHVGYYTLLAARLVGPAGAVHAFEPDAVNARYLRRHLRLNRRVNVQVSEVAVSDREGRGAFAGGSGSGTGRLDVGGGREVETVRLDGYCAAHAIRPDALKIDAEGAELRVLHGAGDLLERRPVIFLSTHGADLREGCAAFLRERGYQVSAIPGAAAKGEELLCTPAC